nr:hypothetical protein [Candidatus Sigynarchaeota archaeon]
MLDPRVKDDKMIKSSPRDMDEQVNRIHLKKRDLLAKNARLHGDMKILGKVLTEKTYSSPFFYAPFSGSRAGSDGL